MTTPTDEFGQSAVLEAEAQEGCSIFRVRTDRPEDPAIAEFTAAVVVRWEYSPEARGMPGAADTERMDSFESAIDELTSANGLSYLMLVTTGMGLKEWLFYTSDQEEFIQSLNQRTVERAAADADRDSVRAGRKLGLLGRHSEAYAGGFPMMGAA